MGYGIAALSPRGDYGAAALRYDRGDYLAARRMQVGDWPRLTSLYRGDPFLGGLARGLVKVVGGGLKVAGRIVPGPVGAIARTVGGVLSPEQAAAQQQFPVMDGRMAESFTGLQAGAGPFGVEVGTRTQTSYFGEATGLPAPTAVNGACCPTGGRLNKSSYFLRSGEFVPEKTRCVKSRRKNLGNMKALRSAESRVNGFVGVARKALKHTDYTVVRRSSQKRLAPGRKK